jgi:CRISPR-associated protein Csh1
MLAEIITIGKLLGSDDEILESSRAAEAPKMILISVNTEKDTFDIELEDFDQRKKGLYLYKRDASKGTTAVPCTPFNYESQKKDKSQNGQEKKKITTSQRKIVGWIKKCKEVNVNDLASFLKELQSNVDIGELKNSLDFLGKVYSILSDNEEAIARLIGSKYEAFTKAQQKAGVFLSLKVNGKYVGEYKICRDCMSYFEREKEKESENKGSCALCGQQGTVMGNVSVFKFYVIDKPGFIMGGFREKDAWKNFPVCKNCKQSMERGKQWLESKSKFKFYGLSYYLIPKLTIHDDLLFKQVMDIISEGRKQIKLDQEGRKIITNDENEILDYVSNQRDYLTLNFLFLKKDQSAERILLLIEDVFPSRIRKIFEAKKYVDDLFETDYKFNKIRIFFSELPYSESYKSDTNRSDEQEESESVGKGKFEKYFLDVVDCVFKATPMSFQFLAKFFMIRIRHEFLNNRNFLEALPRVRDAIMDTIFFNKVGVLSFKEENMQQSLFTTIFEDYAKALDTPVKRGIFLLGALTQRLLIKQIKEKSRGEDEPKPPFLKKLKGLRMNEKDIKGLLPAVQNKLEEYNGFQKAERIIAAEATHYLLQDDNWKLSTDEINFYFVCGMNLSEKVSELAFSKTDSSMNESTTNDDLNTIKEDFE